MEKFHHQMWFFSWNAAVLNSCSSAPTQDAGAAVPAAPQCRPGPPPAHPVHSEWPGPRAEARSAENSGCCSSEPVVSSRAFRPTHTEQRARAHTSLLLHWVCFCHFYRWWVSSTSSSGNTVGGIFVPNWRMATTYLPPCLSAVLSRKRSLSSGFRTLTPCFCESSKCCPSLRGVLRYCDPRALSGSFFFPSLKYHFRWGSAGVSRPGEL